MELLDKLKLIKKRWLVGVISVMILIILAWQFFFSVKSKPETQIQQEPTAMPISNRPISDRPTNVTEMPNESPATSTFTLEQLQIIEKQSQADEIVGQREKAIRTSYPWFIKLPLRGEKYFVYFETNSKVFVGLLYPVAGDDVSHMKREIINKLKDVYGVPVADFAFEWKISS